MFLFQDPRLKRYQTQFKVIIIKLENLDRKRLKKKINFLEIGIGSGVLFLSILKNNPDFNCVGLDINPRAINLSRKNMKLNKIKSENVLLKLIDFNNFSLSNEHDKFDFIISNPPYISEKNKSELAKELRQSVYLQSYESDSALFSGEDGLDLIKIIIQKSKELLREKAFVIIEFHPEQKDALIIILLRNGIKIFFFEKDFLEKERFLIYKIPKQDIKQNK